MGDFNDRVWPRRTKNTRTWHHRLSTGTLLDPPSLTAPGPTSTLSTRLGRRLDTILVSPEVWREQKPASYGTATYDAAWDHSAVTMITSNTAYTGDRGTYDHKGSIKQWNNHQ